MTDRICVSCGCRLANDNASSLCAPCLQARRAYNPFHDPQLGARLLDVLKANRRRPVNVYRALGIEHCGRRAWDCVQGHIKRLRRQGHVIVGGHHVYEYRGCRAPRNVRVKGSGSR